MTHIEGALDQEYQSDCQRQFVVSEEFVPSPEHKIAKVTSMDYGGLLSVPLKLREDLSNGCGGQVWPAGMVLARYMLRKHSANLADKSMLVTVELRALK